MVFKDFWIILLVPLVILWGLEKAVWSKKKLRTAGIRFSSISIFSSLKPTWKTRLNNFSLHARLAAIVFFIIAFAGPRWITGETEHQAQGIDIVLAVDASGSMAAEDFVVKGKRKNRLEIVKEVVKEFIDERQNDRIGMVAFGGLAYTVSPMTTDYQWLKMNLDRLELDLVEDGTAVGSAVASSLSRLKKSDAKSKIIILLTDGINNAGSIDPVEAANAAKAMNVKIYTIGAGTTERVPLPAQDIWGRKRYVYRNMEIDEALLKKIAEITGGYYYRATDTESLKNVYKEINTLETSEIQIYGYTEYAELFGYFLAAGLALLLLDLILSNSLLLRLP